MLARLKANLGLYVWKEMKDPEGLARVRMAAMRIFLDDYGLGRRKGRLLPHSLPMLLFEESSFELALCSHLLFTYSEHFSEDFHYESIIEMLRVAPEARVFPVLDLSGKTSPHLGPVMERLSRAGGLNASLCTVDYEFQKNGNVMFKVKTR